MEAKLGHCGTTLDVGNFTRNIMHNGQLLAGQRSGFSIIISCGENNTTKRKILITFTRLNFQYFTAIMTFLIVIVSKYVPIKKDGNIKTTERTKLVLEKFNPLM